MFTTKNKLIKNSFNSTKMTNNNYSNLNIKNFAYWVAGPRDFLINLAINSFMPWWTLKQVSSVVWLGNPSIMSLFAPMAFLLVSMTTFFGLFNGLTKGTVNKEVLIDRFQKNTAWLKPVLIKSLIYGLVSLIIFIVIIMLCNYFSPNSQFPKNPVIVFQGIFAAFFAYFVGINGVLTAEKTVQQK